MPKSRPASAIDNGDGVTVNARVPREVADRLDRIAGLGGLTRPQFLRIVLARVTEDDLPPTLREAASDLRLAQRGVLE